MFFKGLLLCFVTINSNMPRKGKKHEILGGIKVSSQQLSE
jgi:hypothetical protein